MGKSVSTGPKKPKDKECLALGELFSLPFNLKNQAVAIKVWRGLR